MGTPFKTRDFCCYCGGCRQLLMSVAVKVPAVFTSNWQWPSNCTNRRTAVGCVPEGPAGQRIQRRRVWIIPPSSFAVRLHLFFIYLLRQLLCLISTNLYCVYLNYCNAPLDGMASVCNSTCSRSKSSSSSCSSSVCIYSTSLQVVHNTYSSRMSQCSVAATSSVKK